MGYKLPDRKAGHFEDWCRGKRKGVLEGDRRRSEVEALKPGITLFSFGYKGNAFRSFGDKRTNVPFPEEWIGPCRRNSKIHFYRTALTFSYESSGFASFASKRRLRITFEL